MVGGGRETSKASTFKKDTNRTSEKFKKKSIQPPAIKSSSPSLVEAAKSVVIDDDLIDKLIIKHEDLDLIRKSLDSRKQSRTSRLSSPPKTYAVKVAKPTERKRSGEKVQKFVVAKPAPQNAKLKPIDSAPCGPRYTKDGEIIPHSILGTVQDFVSEAIRRKEMEADSTAASAAFQDSGLLEVKKYERPSSAKVPYIPTAFNQENALLNWRKRMAERKRMQGYISDLLEKPLDRLVMSQDINAMRKIKETRTAIERSVDRIEYGKEEARLTTEFWKQTVIIGDPVDGLLTSLTKSEKGMPSEIEHVGKSSTLLNETGESCLTDRPTVDPRIPWIESKYLKKRVRQLKPFLKDIDPLSPNLSQLEVTGSKGSKGEKLSFTDTDPRFRSSLYADIDQSEPFEGSFTPKPLEKYPDVVDNPMMGPSILFDGIPAYWNGSSDNNKDQVGVVTRVNFECIAGQRTYTSIDVKNNGTTAIFYEWRKIPYKASFEALKPDQIQRFYFNSNEGQILPGDTLHISFVFKSSIAGIFSETWEFLTTPAIMGGASLCAVLKGVAVLDDSDTTAKRVKIEEDLAAKDAKHAVKKIVDDLMRGIQTPERPRSPLDRYKTEEQIFLEKNPRRCYNFDAVQQLKEIYVQTIVPDSAIFPEWGLSIVELTTCVLTVPDEEKRSDLLFELNRIVSDNMSFPTSTPRRNMLFDVAYFHLSQMLEKFVSCSMLVRSTMGLPEVVFTEPVTVPEIRSSAHSTHHSGSPTHADEKKRRVRKSTGTTTSKDAKEDKTRKDKNPVKEPPKEKESRPRTATKPKSQLSAHDDGSKRGAGKRGNTPPPTMTVEMEEETSDDIDPDLMRKYIHKLYGHVHSLVGNMIEDMVGGFEAVGKADDLSPSILKQ